MGVGPAQVHTWARHGASSSQQPTHNNNVVAPREAPQVRDAVSEAMSVMLDLPLGVIPKRHFPPLQQHSTRTALQAGGSGLQPLAPKPTKNNMARAKWGLVSFHNPEVIQLHRDVTETILDHRLAYRQCNTRCTFPDVVPEEALSYYRPRDEFGSDWEMFDAKKHIRVDELARVAKQRRSQAALEEFCKSNTRRSTSRSPSGRRSTSQLRRDESQSSPMGHASEVKDAAVSILSSVDVHQLVPDDEIPKLFEPDLVKEEIAKLQWDLSLPATRRMAQEASRCNESAFSEGRSLAPTEAGARASRGRHEHRSCDIYACIDTIFLLWPYSGGPKHPVLATSHGSGVPTAILRGGHLTNEYVIRQQAGQRNQSGVLIDKAPVIVQGMRWGEI